MTQPSKIDAIFDKNLEVDCYGGKTFFGVDTIYGGTGKSFNDFNLLVEEIHEEFVEPRSIFRLGGGNYKIRIQDPSKCEIEETLNIYEPNEIQVKFDPEILVVKLGDTSNILEPLISSDRPISSLFWKPSFYLSDTFTLNPIVNPSKSINYELRVLDSHGCEGLGILRVVLDERVDIFIPNSFFPNGDGINDYFKVFNCKAGITIKNVSIYDRWGNVILKDNSFHPVDCNNGTPIWNGYSNGNLISPGEYPYHFEMILF